MTNSGQCLDCGRRALNENAYGISEHRGPAFERWRRAMAASVGARLLDDDASAA
jgi:hypothetical protein